MAPQSGEIYRLHHVRPRFKNNVESVLLYMASEIVRIGEMESKNFKQLVNHAIKLFPGNYDRKVKTINNWRTEISSLFGLYIDDGNIIRPGNMAVILDESEDLPMFFKYFLYYFQYPGGHLKPHETLEMIKVGIKFKPAKYIIQTLLQGKSVVGEMESFGISKAEATHLIFNFLPVTRGLCSASETVNKIISNRKNKVTYDEDGDVVRYAGDILDYMVLADILSVHYNKRYYLKPGNLELLSSFIDSEVYFHPYDNLYGNKDITVNDVTETQTQWFMYVNTNLYENIFKTNISSFFYKDADETIHGDSSEKYLDFVNRFQDLIESRTTKNIGDFGEALTITHEKNRLRNLGRNDVLHLIKKIPEVFAVGYDIGSYEGNGDLRRYIEVKTTVSKNKLVRNSFHMTTSEWSAASSNKETYFIYRLFISSVDIKLLLIRDPVGQYKNDMLNITARNGVDVTYSEKNGIWEECLYD